MDKLPNYREYLDLQEYRDMIALLQKGVAIHHAGIMPVLREMIELLFDRGFIKLLFATETFAVGINMPTKTVIFSSVESGMEMADDCFTHMSIHKWQAELVGEGWIKLVM